MMLTGTKLKEMQVSLLLSSRAEMQKVIEIARQTTVSFIQLSAPAAAIQPQPAIIPSSLSGFLAQQMVQQTPQHSPVTIIPEPPAINNLNDSKKFDKKTSSSRRRSRSKSRDRRRRSRSRDRSSFRRRDRSKSKDRRRSRRSKSRERNRSREKSRHRSPRDDRKIIPATSIVVPSIIPPPPIQPAMQNFPINNNPVNIWDVPPVNFQGLPFMPSMTQIPPIYNPSSTEIISPPIYTSFNKYDKPPQIPNIQQPHGLMGKSIKISNLDFNTSYGEIRRFFGSLIAQDGIKMINDQFGRRTGSALILFHQVTAKTFALQKSGQMFKNSIVLVEDIDEMEYFNAVDNFKPQHQRIASTGNNRMNRMTPDDDVIAKEVDLYENNIFTTLIIEDIPNFTKEQDIIKMFSDITLKDVIIGKKFNSLKAFAKFYRSDDAKLALNSKQSHFVGYKKVTVSICSDLAFDNAKHDFEQMIVNETIIEQQIKYPTDPRQQKNRFNANENNWNENSEPERPIPDVRSLNFNNFNNYDNPNRFHPNYNNYNNNQRPNQQFDNQNRFNDNRRNGSYDNSDDRNFNRFNQRSYNQNHQNNQNNNHFNDNRQEFNQRFQNQQNSDENQSFNDNYDNNHQNDDFKNVNNGDDNKIDENDSDSIIVIPDDPSIDDEPIDDEQIDEQIDEKNLIIDENIQIVMEQIHTEQQPIREPTPIPEEIPNISDCIILQNLDGKTMEKDVLEFLLTVELVPVNVHMLLDTDNQPSGDCFCEFNCVDDAERAVTLNNKNLGTNSIKIEFIPRFKVEEIISSFKQNDERTNSPRPVNNHQDNHQYQNDFPNFRRNNQNKQNGPNNNYNNNGHNNNYNNNYRGGRGGGGVRVGGGGFNNNRFNNNNFRNSNNRFNSPVNVNEGNNILNMNNIPYRSQASDILHFFGGFDLTEDDIDRRYNNYGKPTAEARIRFSSIDDAREALESCNGNKLGNREIFLSFN